MLRKTRLLCAPILRAPIRNARRYSSKPSPWSILPVLPDDGLSTFRRHAFEPSTPYLLPAGAFAGIPAIDKWFTPATSTSDPRSSLTLNQGYLGQYGDTMLPLEYTTSPSPDSTASTASTAAEPPLFERGPAPLSLFLSWVALATTTTTTTSSEQPPPRSRLYLAQAPLSALPATLHSDLPTPEVVAHAGKGDVYDSSLWLGVAPTYTPLHRDPNPNLFVQLAGTKRVRLLDPETGDGLFGRLKVRLGGDGKGGNKSFRGEEMMKGLEKEVLEEIVWGCSEEHGIESGFETEVNAGDGVFIPQGWWHSVRGVGEGATASVNWWFR